MIEYVLAFNNTYKTEAINVVSWVILVQRKARQLFLLSNKNIMFPDFCGSTLSVSLKWHLFASWFCIKNNIDKVIEYGDRQCLSFRTDMLQSIYFLIPMLHIFCF